jgi:hypothetical protein
MGVVTTHDDDDNHYNNGVSIFFPNRQETSVILHDVIFHFIIMSVGPHLWSSSQEFLATDPEIPGSIPDAIRFSEKY